MTSLLVMTLMTLMTQQAAAHSWIACTDYLEKNGDYWDAGSCRAFARHGWQYTPRDEAFGTDRGYNINNPQEAHACRTSRDDAQAYNSEHPMAAYYPGQEVIIAHPTKVRQILLIILQHPCNVI